MRSVSEYMCVSVVQDFGSTQSWLRNRDMCYLLILYLIVVAILLCEFWKYVPKCCLAGSRFSSACFLFLGWYCIGVSCSFLPCAGGWVLSSLLVFLHWVVKNLLIDLLFPLAFSVALCLGICDQALSSAY